MRVTTNGHPLRLPPAFFPPIFFGFALALFGTYWDDAWHTEIGRDSFLAAPHLALYLGIALVGGTLSLWAFLGVRRNGWRELLAPPLLLSSVGVVIALGAAPIDNAWHLAFGRDAVLWSPPHMLGVAGNLAIAGGLFLELRSRGGTRGRPAALLAATSLLAVAVVPVLEYDTDVPQFDVVFYLPVLAAGSAFAFALVRESVGERFAALAVSLIYAALMSGIALVLLLGDMPGMTVPLLMLPALVMDLGRGRLNLFLLGVAFSLALYLTYVPYLNWVGDGVFLDTTDVIAGFALACVGTWAAFLLVSGSRSSLPQPAAWVGAIALTCLALAVPPPAVGHDPGQGEEVATADLTGRSEGRSAELEVDLGDASDCRSFVSERLTARRAGTTVEGSLRPVAPCRMEGSIVLPDRGRWFVYAEMTYRNEGVETWLPLQANGLDVRSEVNRSVYVPPAVTSPVMKPVAGVVMYAAFTAVVIAISALYRRAAPGSPPGERLA